MSATYCPECRQVVYEQRLGVRIPKIKTRIFDCICRGGEDGVPMEHIIAVVYGGMSNNVNVRNHIHQLNHNYLAKTGVQIYGEWPERGLYRLTGVMKTVRALWQAHPG